MSDTGCSGGDAGNAGTLRASEEQVAPAVDQSNPTNSPNSDCLPKSKASRVEASFLRPGLVVEAVAGKGRGVVAKEAIETPGTVLLRERAAAWTMLTRGETTGEADPVQATVRVLIDLLSKGDGQLADHLEPTLAECADGHSACARHADTIERGLQAAQKGLPHPLSSQTSPAVIKRLLLAVMLNAHSVVTPRRGCTAQALFPRVGAMLNHGESPNAAVVRCTARGSDPVDDASPWLEVRSVRPIAAGEEVTITYLETVYASFPDRDDVLQLKYGFGAAPRPTDPLLEQLVEGKGTDGDAIKRVVHANTLACEAYDAIASNLGGGAAKIAAQQYSAVLREGVLAETHAWHFNAATKLATLLNQTKSPVLCQRALALWEGALEASGPVWPSPLWPERRQLLRGLATAARVVDNHAVAERYEEELKNIDVVLGFLGSG